jgi:thioredoxin 1
MINNTKLGILIALVILVVVVVSLKQHPNSSPKGGQAAVKPTTEAATNKPPTEKDSPQPPSTVMKPPEQPQPAETPAVGKQGKGLPRLVDLGRGTCIPCKKMAPILDELTKEYKGRMQVEVIDLRYKPEAATEYKIQVIPTQIFYDPSGKELFRHRGFMSKEDILAKWKELGFVFSK